MRIWKGEYPDDWNEIAERIKSDVDWRCVRCGHIHDPGAGYQLGVHHLDRDKSNCEWWNLVPLCQRCHLKFEASVHLEQFWMFDFSVWSRPYIAGYYAHIFGLPEDRQYVETHMEEIFDKIGSRTSA